MSKFSEKFQKICQDARLVGANIVVCKDDEIIDKDYYGLASIEDNKKTNHDTVYRIASISKTVLAIGLMQLYEAGKIDLDKDISEYFGYKIRNPKFPDVAITPKMLLLQTSSITDGYDDEELTHDGIPLGYNGVNGTDWDVSVKDLLADTNSKYYTPLTFSDYEPGTHFIYSNFGCGLVACLIERASGEYYYDYMIKHVFEPLGVDASYRAKDIKNREGIASLYNTASDGVSYSLCRSGERFVKGGYKEFPLGETFRGPAGGLFINMVDLSKIMRLFINRGIYNGVRLLKEETVDLMYQTHWFGSDIEGDYRAKGLQMKVMHNFEDRGIAFRGHTGGAYGVRSYMYFNQKAKFGACFITSGGYYKSTSEGILDVFKQTLSALIDEYYPEPTPSEFKFELGEKKATVDNRTIIFNEAPFEYNDEIYLPAISLADGIGIVGHRVDEENSIEFIKFDKSIKFVNLMDFDKTPMAPMKEVLKALDIKYEIDGKKVVIKY